MMLEATAREEAKHVAARTSGGANRLSWFLGASLVLHGLLAVALVRGMPAEVPVSAGPPVAAPSGAEMVWFEGTAEGPSGSAAPAVSAIPAAAPTARQRETPKARPKAVPATRPLRREPEAGQHEEQTPPAPVAASPPVDSSQGSEPPAENSPGTALAEAAAHASSEGAPGAEAGSPGSHAGAAASGGGVGSRSTVAPGNGGPGGPARGDLRSYARALSAAVNRQRRYPEIAVRLGMQGTAHIHLRVRQDGSLMEPPRLVASSGHEVLDAEALRMAEAAAPFGPMPESASRTDAGFVIAVEFFLRRN